MTTATSSDQKESQLNHIAEVARDLIRIVPEVEFSIEVRHGRVYISFTTSRWPTKYTKIIQDLAHDNKLDIYITPLGNRLGITIS